MVFRNLLRSSQNKSRKRCLSGSEVMINIYRNEGRSRSVRSSCNLVSLYPGSFLVVNTCVKRFPEIFLETDQNSEDQEECQFQQKKQNQAKDKNNLI